MYAVFLDSETNGLNPLKHSILEIAYKIVDVRSGEVIESYESVIAQPKVVWEKSDPSSLEVNGFTWDEVRLGRDPKEVAGAIITSFARGHVRRGEAVFICQNPSFDRAFFSQLIDPDLQEALGWPYHWLDLASMYWAKRMHSSPKPFETGVSKDKIAKVYGLPIETKPHRAMNGVDHLLACYDAVVGLRSEIKL